MVKQADTSSSEEPEEPEDRHKPGQVESPLPYRTQHVQSRLAGTLTALPTLAERLRYMIDNESFFYLRRDQPVTDPAEIEGKPRGLKQKRIWPPGIAQWVERRTGETFSKTMIYNFRDGTALRMRTSVTNALADLWRIDPRLLDPSVPASQVEHLHDDPESLDDLDRRTFDLMTKVGFTGVRPREVQSLGQASVEQRMALLEVLQAIDRDRSSPSDSDQSPDEKRT